MISVLAFAATVGWLLALAAIHANGQLLREKINAVQQRDVWQRQADRNMNDLCEANRLLQEWMLSHQRLQQKVCDTYNDAFWCRHNLFHVSNN